MNVDKHVYYGHLKVNGKSMTIKNESNACHSNVLFCNDCFLISSNIISISTIYKKSATISHTQPIDFIFNRNHL